jgi:hypothetical protein
MNVKRLLKVKKAILDNPKKVNMDTWIGVSNVDLQHQPKELKSSECQTTGCIAGWTCANFSKKKFFDDPAEIQYEANYVLEIDRGDISDELFFLDCWPISLRVRLDGASTSEEYVQVIADRIDAFIEEYGDQ